MWERQRKGECRGLVEDSQESETDSIIFTLVYFVFYQFSCLFVCFWYNSGVLVSPELCNSRVT